MHKVEMYSRWFYKHASHNTLDICITYWELKEGGIILLLHISCLMETVCEDVNLHRMGIHGGFM